MSVNLSPNLHYSNTQLARARQQVEQELSRLSSGVKLQKAADDPSDYALSNHLRADAKMLRMARQNAFDGLSFIQVTEGIMDETTNMLTRAAQLATQAASGTTSANGKQAIDEEYQEILAELDRIQQQSEYNDLPIFGNSIVVQFGDTGNESITVTNQTIDATSFALNGTDMTTSANAELVLERVSEAINTLSDRRSILGAQFNRLRNTLDVLDQKILDTTAAESAMRDADIATEVSNLTMFQMQQQSAQAALAQGQVSAERVLRLFA